MASQKHVEKFTCLECNKEFDVEFWDVVDLRDFPSAKDSIKSLNFFMWECPECGSVITKNKSLVYYDPETKLLIVYVASCEEAHEMMELMQKGEGTLPVLPDVDISQCIRRVTMDINEVVEKIRIFDAGRDDRTIELMKLVIDANIRDNTPEIEIQRMFYYQDDEGERIQFLDQNHEVGEVLIDEMVTGFIERKFVVDFPPATEDKAVVIGEVWAMNKMNMK